MLFCLFKGTSFKDTSLIFKLFSNEKVEVNSDKTDIVDIHIPLNNDGFIQFRVGAGWGVNVEFARKKITEFTAYNKIVMYKTEITDFILMHNYLQSNHDYYVSSIDVMAFPNYTDEKNVETGTLIVWEKCDLMDEWTSLLLKKYFLGINGLSKQELQENESRIEIIENLIIIAGRDADD